MFNNNGRDRSELRAQARQRELSERAQNELLEQRLSALDRGEPLEAVLGEGAVRKEAKSLADTAPLGDPAELGELIKLAAALRGVTLPFLGVTSPGAGAAHPGDGAYNCGAYNCGAYRCDTVRGGR